MSYVVEPGTDPQEVRRRRRLAEALLQQGTDTSPILSPWQGAARLAQGLMGGYELGLEDKRDREDRDYNKGLGSELDGTFTPKPAGPVSTALGATSMPPEQVKAVIDANVPEHYRDYAYRMAEKESNFNPAISSPTGATGLFQFTKGTGKSYGLIDDGGDYRTDPARNTKAFVQFTEDNRAGLRRVLGREPSLGELALAHQQGLGGATALLTGQGTVNPQNLAVQAGNPKNAADVMRYYGFAGGDGQPTLAGGSDTLGTGAPAPAAQPMTIGTQQMQRALQIMSDPRASAGIRERAKYIYQQGLEEQKRLREQNDPKRVLELEKTRLELDKLRNPPAPEKIRTLQAAGIPPAEINTILSDPNHPKRAFVEKVLGGGGVTVNNAISTGDQADKRFFEKLDEGAAKRWETYNTRGDQAQAMMGDLMQLREISRAIGQQGAGVNVKAALGPYAEALGINIEGLDDIQTFDSIVNRLAPQLREPGSGSTSDIEFKGFLKSIGTLSNNPMARERIIDTFEAFARHDMARAEIGSRLRARELTVPEAEKQIRALPDPLTSFRKFKKDNPDLFKGGPIPPPASEQPAPAASPKGFKILKVQ